MRGYKLPINVENFTQKDCLNENIVESFFGGRGLFYFDSRLLTVYI